MIEKLKPKEKSVFNKQIVVLAKDYFTKVVAFLNEVLKYIYKSFDKIY